MDDYTLVHLPSLKDFRAQADKWDDLWQRSEATIPLARAEPTALWVEQFARHAACHGLVVEREGRWLAGLLLVEGRAMGLMKAGRLPADFWISGAGFLADPLCDVPGVLDRLVSGTRRLPWPVLWLDEAYLDWPSWKALLAAFSAAGMASSVRAYYLVPRIEIDHNWPAFYQHCSKKFREQLSRSARRLAELGEVRFQTRSCFDRETLDAWLARGFDVENRNWKGRTGRSVLREGMLPYIARQASQLAQWGHLHLSLLECAGRPIAFAYGATAKGVYHSIRIGYDEEYARFSPGHILRRHLFQQLWEDAEYRAVDFTAGMTEAQVHWKPPTYPAGDIVVAPRGVISRGVVYAHRFVLPSLRPICRYLRGRQGTSSASGRCGSEVREGHC